MTWGQMPELPCGCRPTAYDGSSTTLVHAYYCPTKKEEPLSVEEFSNLRKLIVKPEVEAEAHSMNAHPARYRTRVKARPLYCRCSSPVMPCPVHKDPEDWWE